MYQNICGNSVTFLIKSCNICGQCTYNRYNQLKQTLWHLTSGGTNQYVDKNEIKKMNLI